MKTLQATIALKLVQAGIFDAVIRFFGSEGFSVRVTSVKAVFAAEEIAKGIKTNFGVDVLVCF